MAVLAEHFILRKEKTLDSTHERTALAGEVADSLTLECGLEQVARADADAESKSAVKRAAGGVLIYCKR